MIVVNLYTSYKAETSMQSTCGFNLNVNLKFRKPIRNHVIYSKNMNKINAL